MRKRKISGKPDKAPFTDRVTHFFRKNHQPILWTVFAIYVVCSFLTFNLRISEGGDDSTYIIRALELLEQGNFPKYQGPLYPMVLAGFMSLTGASITFLKFTSWIFLTLAIVFIYKAYRKHISPVVLWGTILVLVVNHHFLYFGSQTYSEAFFILLQGLLFLFLFRINQSATHDRVKIRQTLLIGFLLFLLTLTRTVAIAALPAIVVFWFLKRQNRAALTTILFFVLFIVLFAGIRTWLTGDPFHGDKQMNTLIWEDPYDPSEGMETFGGFFERFAGNSNIYLSKYLPILTGFKPALSLSKNALITILLYAWFLIGFIRFLKKKHDPLLLTGLYIAFMCGATFFALQTMWDQVRLIIPFFPLMLIFLGETIASFTRESQHGWKQKIPLLLFGLSILLITAQTVRQTDFNSVFKNISGDRYYGYTPDWQNYLKMAEYTAENLPDNTYVACRKPNMARLYGDFKKFYGIYRFQTQNADSLLNRLYQRGVTHVIVGSLRKNPRQNTGQVINTIHRYLRHIADEYPNIIKPVRKTGKQEPAWLFEINYNNWPKRPERDTPETEK